MVIGSPVFDLDHCFESLMPAMLRPGLGNSFEFYVGRIAAFGLEPGLNSFHLSQVQRGAAGRGNCQQFRVAQSTQADGHHLPARGGFLGEGRGDRAKTPTLDGGIRQ